jgi:hypothetical protein
MQSLGLSSRSAGTGVIVAAMDDCGPFECGIEVGLHVSTADVFD